MTCRYFCNVSNRVYFQCYSDLFSVEGDYETKLEKLGGVQGILQRVQSEANVSIVCLGKAMALLLRLKSLSNRDLPEVFYV